MFLGRTNVLGLLRSGEGFGGLSSSEISITSGFLVMVDGKLLYISSCCIVRGDAAALSWARDE